MGIIVNYHLPESWKTQGIQFTKTPGSNSKSQKNPGRILGVQKPRICQSQAAHSSSTFILDHSQSQSQKTSKNRLSLGFFPSSKVQNQDIPGYSTYVGHLDPFRPRSPRSPSSKRREQLIHFQRRYLPKRPHGNFQTKL